MMTDRAQHIVVETRGLTKWYGDARGVVDLDLTVRQGEVFGFIGPNGAGKTTTIRLLLDLIRPSSGSATIFGLDCRRSAIAVRERIGYVPADLQLFDRLTVDGLLNWLGRLRGGHDRAWAAELAGRLSLDTTRTIGDLSTGNRQKVGIVQAFMHRPDLLILDEPTSGLDPLVRRTFRDLVHDAVEDGATVFLSSHVLSEVEDVCGRVAMIVDGRLRRIDSVPDLRKRSLRRVRLTVEGPADLRELAAVASVESVRPVVEPNLHPGLVAADLRISGALHDFLKAACRWPVVDLLSEPVSLEEIFLESYDTRDTEGTESLPDTVADPTPRAKQGRRRAH